MGKWRVTQDNVASLTEYFKEIEEAGEEVMLLANRGVGELNLASRVGVESKNGKSLVKMAFETLGKIEYNQKRLEYALTDLSYVIDATFDPDETLPKDVNNG